MCRLRRLLPFRRTAHGVCLLQRTAHGMCRLQFEELKDSNLMNHRFRDILQRLGRPVGRLAVVALGSSYCSSSCTGRRWLAGRSCFRWICWPSRTSTCRGSRGNRCRFRQSRPHGPDLCRRAEPAIQSAGESMPAVGRAGCPTSFPACRLGAKFSVFWWLGCSVQSPVVLAWVEMAIALVAGFGIYAFGRSVLARGVLAGRRGGLVLSAHGIFHFWQGYGLASGAAWLPWLLLAVDKTVRQASRWSGPGLALVTGLVIADGRLDIAGQVLLTSGIYALWCFFDHYGKQWLNRRAVRSLAAATAAWGLGFLLVAGHLLPTWEYTRTGAMMRRSAGEEERPPVGLTPCRKSCSPTLRLTQIGSLFFAEGEGTSWKAPRRRMSACWPRCWWPPWVVQPPAPLDEPALAGAPRAGPGLGPEHPGPGLPAALPLLNMMSHNRFVFVASFVLMAMTAEGLDVLAEGSVPRRPWFWCVAALVAILLAWCPTGPWSCPSRSPRNWKTASSMAGPSSGSTILPAYTGCRRRSSNATR